MDAHRTVAAALAPAARRPVLVAQVGRLGRCDDRPLRRQGAGGADSCLPALRAEGGPAVEDLRRFR